MMLQDRHEEHLRLRGALFDPFYDDLILDQRLYDKQHQFEQLILIIVVGDALQVDVPYRLLALLG